MKKYFLILSLCLLFISAKAETADEAALAMMKADPVTAKETAGSATPALAPQTEAQALAVEAPKAETKNASLKDLKESEIPVVLDNSKKSSNEGNPIFKMILSLSIIGVLVSGGYFFLKKYVKKGNKNNKATQIKVLTQHYLGPKKSIAIIRVAGESILVGITDHNINMLKSLSLLDEDIPEETPKNFENVFNKVGKASASEGFVDENPEDEFSISGIKDFVSTKLKTMRSIE